MYETCNMLLATAAPVAADILRSPGWTVSWEQALAVWFNWISPYGWRVIVFTILLKLLIFPLDFYQRFMMRKNQKINERIAPDVEKLKKMYPDKQVFFQKQRQLHKKEGYKPLAACLPAIVTMLIFLSLWQGMLTVGQHRSMENYLILHDRFISVQTESLENGRTEAEALADARASVSYAYWYGDRDEGGRERFLWIRNLWVPDVPWTRPVRAQEEFFGSVDRFYSGIMSDLSESQIRERYDIYKLAENGLIQGEIEGGRLNAEQVAQFNERLNEIMLRYDTVMHDAIHYRRNNTNGFLILVILAVGLNFLTQFLTTRMQKKAGMNPMGMGGMGGTEGAGGALGSMMSGGRMMKMMLFMMPLMMGFFAISMASAFTLYMVMNAALTTAVILIMSLIFKLMDKKRESNKTNKVQKYGRPDPNANVQKYGRPDPNAGKKEVKQEVKQEKEKNIKVKEEKKAEVKEEGKAEVKEEDSKEVDKK